MTRIIAGFARSLALKVPNAGTRPTSDRIREAIFSALASRDAIVGAHVLDLYAGSGALGLEAASRGAASVILVDKARAATLACIENSHRVKKNAPDGTIDIRVSDQSVQSFLSSSTAIWNIAFLDPPYDAGETELNRTLEALLPRLSAEAIVMVERSSKSPAPMPPPGLVLDRSKVYGDTTIWWLSPE